MRKIIHFLVIFMLSIGLGFNTFAQKWGANTTSLSVNEAFDVKTDQVGNVYVVGYLTGVTHFTSVISSGSALGNGDVYVAKYNPTGQCLWIRQFGGNQSDRAWKLAVGSDQNIVVTGHFFGQIQFDNFTLNSNQQSKDIFVVKLNSNGTVLWAFKEGGAGAENVYGIAFDASSNVVLTGQYSGNSTIAGQNFTTINDPITGLPSYDFFISKYNSSGSPLWVRVGVARKEDRGMAVATDNSGNIFVCGQFSDTLNFTGNIINNSGQNVGFVTKLNPNGQLDFFRIIRAGLVLPYDIKINNQGHAVLCGDFLGNLIYNPGSNQNTLSSSFAKKIFVLQIDNNGTYQWGYRLGSNNDVSAKALVINNTNQVFVTGFFRCDLSELHQPQTSIWNSVGFKDGYLLKLNSNGQFTFAKQFGGQLDDEGHGITLNDQTTPIICGSYTKHLHVARTNGGSSVIQNNENQLFQDDFGYFFSGDSTRNSFVMKYLDQDIVDYNFFINEPIDSLIGQIPAINDTIFFCFSTYLSYDAKTLEVQGPSYNYLWSTGSTENSIGVSDNNNYSVTVTRKDACSSGSDGVVTVLLPFHPRPLMTDNKGIAVNAPGILYADYHFCFPDSVEVNFTLLQPNQSITLTLDTTVIGTGTGPFMVHQEGTYYVEATNLGCNERGFFHLEFDHPIPYNTIDYGIDLLNNPLGSDTITICEGDVVEIFGFNKFVNPNAHYLDFIEPVWQNEWSINGINYTNETWGIAFHPPLGGWYHIRSKIWLGYENLCGIDTTSYIAIDSFFE